MATAQHNALPNGYEFDDYRIEAVLGAGGFGITYRATELSVDRKVAIKEYLPQGVAMRERNGVSVHPVSDADEADYLWGLERFRNEAQTLVRFRHPNIVSMLRYFARNGTAYLVMEYQDGEPLDNILAKGATLGEDRLMPILMPLLDGLAEVHAAGFLHRDIKPGNIYIRADGIPVLIDFGAARQALGERSKSLTAIVTSGYAPVEQYSTQSDQGPWTDIYALAATLYRAITGKSPPDATERVLSDTMVPPGKAAKGRYSASLLAAIETGLAVRPEDRPRSIADWRRIFAGARVKKKKKTSAAVRVAVAATALTVVLIGGGAAWWVTQPPAEPAPLAGDMQGNANAEGQATAAAEEEDRRAAEEEARRRAEEDAKRKAEAAAEAKRAAEAEARRKAEDDARRKAEEEARREGDAAAKRKAEAEAKARADLERRLKLAEARAKEAERKASAAAKARKAAAKAAARKAAAAKRKEIQQAARPSARNNPFLGKTAYLSRLSSEQGMTMRIQLVFRPDGSLDAKCVAESPTGAAQPCIRTIGQSGSGLWSFAGDQLCLTAAVIGESARNCYAVKGKGGQYTASGGGVFAGPFMLR